VVARITSFACLAINSEGTILSQTGAFLSETVSTHRENFVYPVGPNAKRWFGLPAETSVLAEVIYI
jgi:hypothetical protein